MLPTAPLREEHRELLPHVDALRRVAEDVGRVDVERLRIEIDDAYEFLAHQLIPHAMAEDEALYPVVARLMGAPRATDTMRRDHIAVRQLVDALGAARSELARTRDAGPLATELLRILFGLHALVATHFAKEEEIYLPLLDERLTQDEASAMFATMERTAARAKGAAV